MSLNRDEFVERVNAIRVNAIEEEGELGNIVSELLTEFARMEDKEVHETLIFIQSQVEAGDISENPFHNLMSELGENEPLFQRMSDFVTTQEPETTADDSSD